jgi:RNA:NAD 2'-phosphotransferase (TPT1/KptA family)
VEFLKDLICPIRISGTLSDNKKIHFNSFYFRIMADDLETQVHSRTPIDKQESKVHLRTPVRTDARNSPTSWRSQTNHPISPNKFKRPEINNNPLDTAFTNLQLSDRKSWRQINHSSGSKYETNAAYSVEQLSRSLFFALKNPHTLGLCVTNNFLSVSAILRHPTLVAKKHTFEDVERVTTNRNDKNFGLYKLLKHDDQNWSIGLVEVPRFERENKSFVTDDSMHKVLFEVLDQELGRAKTETDSIDCNDLLQIPSVNQAQIKLEDIERILTNTDDPSCDKYIFLPYENGLCLIKKNYNFTSADRKVKFKNNEKWFSDRVDAIDSALTYHLRHNIRLNTMTADGFVNIVEILRLPQMKKNNCTIEDLKIILSQQAAYSHSSYVMIEDEQNRYKIRATHGHSIPKVMAWNWANWKCETKLPILAHRCNYSTWAKLRHDGFEKSKRKSISFNDPEDKQVKYRREVEIWIDAVAAREDGVKFFQVPENPFIISELLADGLPLRYFLKVFDRKTGEIIKVIKSNSVR